jgi:secreted trypsin-like serine protease
MFKYALLTIALVCGANAQAKCGMPAVKPKPCSSKIVGGCEAVPYSWPWQVVLDAKEGFFQLECGGSSIAPQWVMSAGHCVADNLHPDYYQVKLGVFNEALNNEKGEILAKVSEVHLNPKFDDQTIQYDISLLKLDKPVNYTANISPVCLPLTDTHVINSSEIAWVTGWGTLTEGSGQIPKKLHQVQLPFLDQSVCDQEYGTIDDTTMFCAGKAGLDSCQGDSGGPLMWYHADTQQYYEYGIVSWGQGCAEQGHAGVYSRVTAYCDWIKTTTGGAASCQ